MKREGPGRPPSRPKDLVAFTALMSPRAKQRLKALAQLEHNHAYALLEVAFWEFWEQLPRDRRSAAEMIAAAIEDAKPRNDA